MSDRELDPPAASDGPGGVARAASETSPPQGAREAMQALADARRRDLPEDTKLRLRGRLAVETGALSVGRAAGVAHPLAGPARPASPAGTAWGRTAAAVIVAFAGGAVLGGVVVGRLGTPRLVAVPIGQDRAIPPSSLARAVGYEDARAFVDPNAAVASVVAPAEAPAATDATRALPARGAPGRGGGRDTDLAAERALLEIARTAIARRNARTALEALARHAREFPNGRLAEERESLFVQALVQADRLAEARERASRFRRRHPDSLLLPAVESAISPQARP